MADKTTETVAVETEAPVVEEAVALRPKVAALMAAAMAVAALAAVVVAGRKKRVQRMPRPTPPRQLKR